MYFGKDVGSFHSHSPKKKESFCGILWSTWSTVVVVSCQETSSSSSLPMFVRRLCKQRKASHNWQISSANVLCERKYIQHVCKASWTHKVPLRQLTALSFVDMAALIHLFLLGSICWWSSLITSGCFYFWPFFQIVAHQVLKYLVPC